MTKRILIVDDAATVRLYHRSMLESAGYQVSEAVNGVEALEKALAADPAFDLYLVDINMPKLNGYGFLRELRAQPIPQGPAVMISTEAKPSDQAIAWQAGASYYVVKPVKPAHLLRVVRLLLGDRSGK